MPDGKIVECYAQSQRDRIDGKGAFKNITFHPEVLKGIRARKERAGIFIDSMSDLCGEGVRQTWIAEVIGCMRDCPKHIFFVLTKNPRRLMDFTWPINTFVGISSPPSFMYGKELTDAQQRTWFRKGFEWLMKSNANFKWVSFEPLAINVVETLSDYSDFDGGPYRGLDWAVIGAGSDGRKTYQPDEGTFKATLEVLQGTPIFYKGNLDRGLAKRHGGWREEFPKIAPIPKDTLL